MLLCNVSKHYSNNDISTFSVYVVFIYIYNVWSNKISLICQIYKANNLFIYIDYVWSQNIFNMLCLYKN